MYTTFIFVLRVLSLVVPLFCLAVSSCPHPPSLTIVYFKLFLNTLCHAMSWLLCPHAMSWLYHSQYFVFAPSLFFSMASNLDQHLRTRSCVLGKSLQWKIGKRQNEPIINYIPYSALYRHKKHFITLPPQHSWTFQAVPVLPLVWEMCCWFESPKWRIWERNAGRKWRNQYELQ